MEAFLLAVEWRVLAAIITFGITFIFTGEIWKATTLTFALQVILFVSQWAWLEIRVV